MTRSAEAASTLKPANGARTFGSFREIADFLWQNAERMRGAYKPNEYDKVILPLLVVRRLDCVLEPTKEKVLARLEALKDKGMKATDPTVDVALRKVTGVPFYNTSRLDFAKLKGDPNHIAQNLRAYLKGFSANARDIVEQFKFDEQITRLDEANLLYQVIGLFADVNLHPDEVPNHVMGSVFEELIRRCSCLRQDYLYMVLNCTEFRAYFEPILTGVSVPHISGDQILGFRFPLPALGYQEEGVRRFSNCERARVVVEQELRKRTESIREYRQTLLSAAVTGKLDVSREALARGRAAERREVAAL